VTNDDLETQLHGLFRQADPVPEAALRAARDSLGWRQLDRELAELTADTTADRELAHVRGVPPRLLTFRGGDLTIDLEVGAENGLIRLLGQLDPPGPATVTVESAAGSLPVQADARGRFSVTVQATGRVRVLVDVPGADAARITTEWFRA
jgi:hypothetical protein